LANVEATAQPPKVKTTIKPNTARGGSHRL
jgi:hypothetical protein